MQNQFTSPSVILEVECAHWNGYDFEDTSFDGDRVEDPSLWEGINVPFAGDSVEACPYGEFYDTEVDPPDYIELEVPSDCEETVELDVWDTVILLREELWATLDTAEELLCELAEIRGCDMVAERSLKDAIEELLLGG